ncbi:hypothetical protein CSC46_3782 [Pseudomonas aeruginosa]|nr:hypothetical protein CSC46_3782 [Pseudomonas aeruginosa]
MQRRVAYGQTRQARQLSCHRPQASSSREAKGWKGAGLQPTALASLPAWCLTALSLCWPPRGLQRRVASRHRPVGNEHALYFATTRYPACTPFDQVADGSGPSPTEPTATQHVDSAAPSLVGEIPG